MNRNLLEVKKVNAGYGFLQILRDVSFNVLEGEFVALLGPNGSGKTTTLRTITGLIRPTGGTINFEGQSIGGCKTNEITRRGISFISEDSNLFLAMSVHENLLLGAHSTGTKSQVAGWLESVFDLFPGLRDRRTQLAGTLSGGQRKMLGIGRGLMSKPRLLLVDEPSLGLAPNLIPQVFAALRSLNQSGLAILLVEQNVKTTLQIAKRGYVLEQGYIALQGASTDLLETAYVQKSYLGK
ncbi:MAG TPA: ABC transporter ATP-binding protein [Acidobacteriota bacterium]